MDKVICVICGNPFYTDIKATKEYFRTVPYICGSDCYSKFLSFGCRELWAELVRETQEYKNSGYVTLLCHRYNEKASELRNK